MAQKPANEPLGGTKSRNNSRTPDLSIPVPWQKGELLLEQNICIMSNINNYCTVYSIKRCKRIFFFKSQILNEYFYSSYIRWGLLTIYRINIDFVLIGFPRINYTRIKKQAQNPGTVLKRIANSDGRSDRLMDLRTKDWPTDGRRVEYLGELWCKIGTLKNQGEIFQKISPIIFEKKFRSPMEKGMMEFSITSLELQ